MLTDKRRVISGMLHADERTSSLCLKASSSSLSPCDEALLWSTSSASNASASSANVTPDGITTEHIKYVRSHLESEYEVDDVTVKRFIRATGGNLLLASKRLNVTLAWRKKVKPEKVVCRACARDPKSHYMHTIGYCLLGRPIIYSCLELATNKVFEDNRDHMIQTFETAVKCMPAGVEQWIWVCDFKGFGMVDVNPKLAKLFLDLSGDHYPERLGLFLVVDAPSLFGLLWRAISSFVDPKTYKKIRFLPFDADKADALAMSKLKAEMDLHFDSETTTWLLREMSENRVKGLAAKKSYNMYSLYEQALEGQLWDGHENKHCHHAHVVANQPAETTAEGGRCQVIQARSGSSAAVAAVELDGAAPHNLLGTSALLHAFNLNPDLLLPQATAVA